MAENDAISLSRLGDYDTDALEYARKIITKEIEKRQGGDLKKLQKQFAKLAGAMGFAPVNPEAGNVRVRRRRRSALPADKQDE